MITEEEARRIHSISEVQMVRLPLTEEPEIGWPDANNGVGIKELYFPEPGIFMGQHAHARGHDHLVGSGEVRVWVEGVEVGDFKAGQVINIEAGKRHILMSLKKDTRGFCLTNITLGENAVVALSECPEETKEEIA